jgi:hypothetical protein
MLLKLLVILIILTKLVRCDLVHVEKTAIFGCTNDDTRCQRFRSFDFINDDQNITANNYQTLYIMFDLRLPNRTSTPSEGYINPNGQMVYSPIEGDNKRTKLYFL